MAENSPSVSETLMALYESETLIWGNPWSDNENIPDELVNELDYSREEIASSLARLNTLGLMENIMEGGGTEPRYTLTEKGFEVAHDREMKQFQIEQDRKLRKEQAKQDRNLRERQITTNRYTVLLTGILAGSAASRLVIEISGENVIAYGIATLMVFFGVAVILTIWEKYIS